MYTLNLTDSQLNVISSALMHRKIELQKQRTRALNARIGEDFRQRIEAIDELARVIYNARKVTTT